MRLRPRITSSSLLVMIAITFPGAMVARAAEHDSKMRPRKVRVLWPDGQLRRKHVPWALWRASDMALIHNSTGYIDTYFFVHTPNGATGHAIWRVRVHFNAVQILRSASDCTNSAVRQYVTLNRARRRRRRHRKNTHSAHRDGFDWTRQRNPHYKGSAAVAALNQAPVNVRSRWRRRGITCNFGKQKWRMSVTGTKR